MGRVVGLGPVERAFVGVGPDAVVERVGLGEASPVEHAPVRRADDVRVGVGHRLGRFAGLDLEEVRRHEAVGQREEDLLHARRGDEADPGVGDLGGGTEIERAVAAARLALDEARGRERDLVEIGERARDRFAGREGEGVPSALGLGGEQPARAARDGDELEALAHEDLELAAEDLHAAPALAEDRQDAAAPDVVDAHELGRVERRRRHAPEGGAVDEVPARRRFRRGGDRGRGRGRGPEEARHAAPRIDRRDRAEPARGDGRRRRGGGREREIEVRVVARSLDGMRLRREERRGDQDGQGSKRAPHDASGGRGLRTHERRVPRYGGSRRQATGSPRDLAFSLAGMGRGPPWPWTIAAIAA